MLTNIVISINTLTYYTSIGCVVHLLQKAFHSNDSKLEKKIFIFLINVVVRVAAYILQYCSCQREQLLHLGNLDLPLLSRSIYDKFLFK